MRTKVGKIGKAVAALVAIVLAGLVVLRVAGPEPAHVDPNIVISQGLNYFVRPAFWQTGEVVRTPVDDWSFVADWVKKNGSIVLETQSPWFIPHAVRVTPIVMNNQVYIPSGQYRMERGYPDRLWASNVFRDPRVRIKVGDKLYEMNLILVTNRAEAEKLLHRNPEMWTKGQDGHERQVGYLHIYRAFQRRIVEHGASTMPKDLSGLPRPQQR
jgi:hypothetical protein